jgi:hypothetical protein
MKVFFATAATEYEATRDMCRIPRNLDIAQAYLARKRGADELDMYMELPDETFGVCRDNKSGYVAKMLRHLYGEVDGGRAFERELLEFLYSIGSEPTVSDRMVFKWKWNGQVLEALAHVDDILYKGSSDGICDEFYRLALVHFGKLTGGEIAEVILGIKVVWDYENCTVTLSQRAHVEKFLDEFGFKYPPNGMSYEDAMIAKSKESRGGYGDKLEFTKKKDTPMLGDVTIVANEGRRVLASEWDTFKWVGYANWLVSMTRVDMAYVVNMIGRHANNPGEEHVKAMKHALRYFDWNDGHGSHFSREEQNFKCSI